MATKKFQGQIIGYEPTQQEKLEKQLKTMFPDGLEGDANTADYALLFAGFLKSIATKNVKVPTSYKIFSESAEIVIDGTTNQITSSTSNVHSFFRSFSSAGVAVAGPGGTVVGFFAGNTASSWYLDSVFDPIFGPGMYRK